LALEGLMLRAWVSGSACSADLGGCALKRWLFLLAIMFLRCRKRLKDGKEHLYWSVVENRRLHDGRVVLYLGELNGRQEASWRKSVELFGQQDASMIEAFDVLFRAAPSSASILILGESGTGKSVAARAVRQRSERAAKPFVTVNCPGLSKELLESELFGHVKGSFTGAVRDHWGKVKAAKGGRSSSTRSTNSRWRSSRSCSACSKTGSTSGSACDVGTPVTIEALERAHMEEADLRDGGGKPRESAETEDGGDHRDDEEGNGPSKHVVGSFLCSGWFCPNEDPEQLLRSYQTPNLNRRSHASEASCVRNFLSTSHLRRTQVTPDLFLRRAIDAICTTGALQFVAVAPRPLPQQEVKGAYEIPVRQITNRNQLRDRIDTATLTNEIG